MATQSHVLLYGGREQEARHAMRRGVMRKQDRLSARGKVIDLSGHRDQAHIQALEAVPAALS